MAPSIDRPTYDIVTFLHRRFRQYFTPGGGPPTIIPRAAFADFVDELSPYTSNHECVRTLLLSFSTNQVPVPDWCPGWLDLDKNFACSDPLGPCNRFTKNQTFGQPSTLLRNIAGTPINTVNPSTPSSSRTALPAQNFSAPPISTLSAGTSPTSSMRQGSSPFLAPKQPTSTLTVRNPTSGRSSSMVAQDDELVSSSPERPLADLVGKPAAKRPVPNPIRPGTFAPFGKQRKPPAKPPVARPPRSLTPEQAPHTTPEPSTSDPKGKKRARPESDIDDGPQSDDPLLDPLPIPTIRLPPREHSSPATIQRRQDQPSTQAAETAESDLRVAKKPRLVEESSEDQVNVEESHDETSEVDPEPKTSKGRKAKKASKKKPTAKPTSPAVRRQQQERYRNAAFPGLAWAEDLQLPVVDNADAFKHFETSLVQLTPVPQSRSNESRTFRASKIDVPKKFILSSELPGFISTDVLKQMNFSAHTNRLACCTCISQTMTKECEGRGPGEKCVNCRTGSCSTHGGFIRQELASMASSRHVLESSPRKSFFVLYS
ncbi:hypothetical protein K435DRAFT_812737 [Dendrothele bispora CBS 962.96]|uniref:Uncharacterized protein n=1 Tax=Dendrothele bispora (strain CBS 962.96) TaxID=1314807 RepID=A0A4S8KN95_DENBC|nr:hypothetical protein K435DRAFT_812737 [Dendrothele bispora CBS 962.96]